MRTYTLPAVWSAKKFRIRYNLNPNQDFYVNANGELVVFPTLPDDPPIFEPSDPLPPRRVTSGVVTETAKFNMPPVGYNAKMVGDVIIYEPFWL